MNCGPAFVSWVLESKDPEFNPDLWEEWLEGRLPKPVDRVASWTENLDEETPVRGTFGQQSAGDPREA